MVVSKWTHMHMLVTNVLDGAFNIVKFHYYSEFDGYSICMTVILFLYNVQYFLTELAFSNYLCTITGRKRTTYTT